MPAAHVGFREEAVGEDGRFTGAVRWVAAGFAATGGASASAGGTGSRAWAVEAVSVEATSRTGSATVGSSALSAGTDVSTDDSAEACDEPVSEASRLMRTQGNAMAIVITATRTAISGRLNVGAAGAAAGIAMTVSGALGDDSGAAGPARTDQ